MYLALPRRGAARRIQLHFFGKSDMAEMKEVFNLNLLYQSNHILTAIHSDLSPVDRYKRRKDMEVSRIEAIMSTSICQRYVNIQSGSNMTGTICV